MKLLRDEIFTSRIEQKILVWYRRFFSIKEIEESLMLKWAFGALVLGHFTAFNSWFFNSATTIDAFIRGKHTCWPYFQTCGEWLFLRTLPHGYSQPILYMTLFGTLVLAVYLMYKKDWVLAHMALVPSFVWHFLGTFVLTQSLSGNYEYYLFILTAIVLFIPYKEYFLKLSLVLFYFLASTIKLHDGWAMGTYFSALKTGLPLFPDWSIPVWTNIVIFSQVIGAWFLMSRNLIVQRLAMVFFVSFHLYSGVLVGFRYPSTVLPMLLIVSGPLYHYTKMPFGKKAIAGWIIVVLMFMAQFISIVIPGDVKMTMEGNKYGLYMFEANHQCVSTATVYRKDGTSEEFKRKSFSARRRCDPYRYAFKLQTHCRRVSQTIERVAWTFDHSINGGDFMRIVDVPNVCDLELKAIGHNKWIKLDADSPEVVGRAAENVYW